MSVILFHEEISDSAAVELPCRLSRGTIPQFFRCENYFGMRLCIHKILVIF
jgi:hypothetical protein